MRIRYTYSWVCGLDYGEKNWASTVCNNADALDLLGIPVHCLTFLQRNILAMAQFDQVLDTVLDRQRTVWVHGANVTRLEPAITRHDLLGFFLQLEVSLHHRWPTEPNLSRSIVAGVLCIWDIY